MIGGIAMLVCWLIQPVVVLIAIRASYRMTALQLLPPNMAIFCGCLQIAMLIWFLIGTLTTLDSA
jgi:hypothetical protein